MTPKESTETMTSSPNNESPKDVVSTSTNYDPKLFQIARSTQTTTIVAGRPYCPTLHADKSDITTVIQVINNILFHNDDKHIHEDNMNKFNVKIVTGGITNTLFRVSGLSHLKDYDSVLVRLFGAEGMIDRDVETATFAALSDKQIAPPYYGRFANGRLEGWLDGCIPLKKSDLQMMEINMQIAVKMAQLHAGFKVPMELKQWHNEEQPGLWDQLFSWMEQAKGISVYKTEKDNERSKALFDLKVLENELNWVKSIISDESSVGFSHNDLLPANIMKHEKTGAVKLIDFEYGGVNFIAFDIANHFNEYAGGPENDEGKTDYSLFPTVDQQKRFIQGYVKAGLSPDDVNTSNEEIDSLVDSLIKEVQGFLLANHLYWGLWAVNQAATEGTESFDYMAYAVNRFNRFFETKDECYACMNLNK